MNRIKLLALLPLMLLTGCSKQRIYVTSMINDYTEKEYFFPDSYETITVKDSDNE